MTQQVNRSDDLAELVVNIQQHNKQAAPAVSTRYLGATENMTAGDSSVLSVTGPPYYCGPGDIGSTDIVSGFWSCS